MAVEPCKEFSENSDYNQKEAFLFESARESFKKTIQFDDLNKYE
jgi:hypothetical protein